MANNYLSCPTCKSKIFDGEVIKGVSIMKMRADGGFSGLCKCCKNWVKLPVVFCMENATPPAYTPVTSFDKTA